MVVDVQEQMSWTCYWEAFSGVTLRCWVGLCSFLMAVVGSPRSNYLLWANWGRG